MEGGALSGGVLGGAGRGVGYLDPRDMGPMTAGQMRRSIADVKFAPFTRDQFATGTYKPFTLTGEAAPGFFKKHWDPTAGPNGTGGLRSEAYPRNNGAVAGTEVDTTIPTGTRLDRWGAEQGRFLSPTETDFSARSIPPTNIGPAPGEYYQYVVTKPFDVQRAVVAPAFGQPGGGTQYLPRAVGNTSRVNVEWLVSNGYLRRVGGPDGPG